MPFVLRITDHWNRSACQVRGARKRCDSIQYAIQPIIGSAQRNWQSQPCQGRKTGRARGHTGTKKHSNLVRRLGDRWHPRESPPSIPSRARERLEVRRGKKLSVITRKTAPIGPGTDSVTAPDGGEPNKDGIAGQDAPRGKIQRLVHASRRQRFRQRRPL